MSTTHFQVPANVKQFGRRTGYAVTILFNLALLLVVINLLEWDVFPWLTDDFSTVVPWIGFSLVASIALNLAYLSQDSRPLRSFGQMVLNLIGIVVISQVFRVFPFDFSQYSFNWEVVVRLLLALAMLGAGIGVITETVKLASREVRTEKRAERR
ncbi:MAG: hypothetical protein ACLFVZ_05785 [Actinomycetota bacterium]